MKHSSRMFRLLALAVVSCVFAVLLTGCTKAEFIAGYNELMFGNWTLKGSNTSSAEPERVYSSPNPECDAKINALMSELYSLESSARSDVESAIQAAKDEYHALPKSQQTAYNKYTIAYAHLSAVESSYDSQVSSVVDDMRSILREYNQPETVADDAWNYYQSAKMSMISSLA